MIKLDGKREIHESSVENECRKKIQRKKKCLRVLLEETCHEPKRQRKGIFKNEVGLNLGG